MNLVDHWGRRSGIVKVIPPQEWCVASPPSAAPSELPISSHLRDRASRQPASHRLAHLVDRLTPAPPQRSCRIEALPKIPPHAIADVKIRSPIQQHMQGRAGLFRVNKCVPTRPCLFTLRALHRLSQLLTLSSHLPSVSSARSR